MYRCIGVRFRATCNRKGVYERAPIFSTECGYGWLINPDTSSPPPARGDWGDADLEEARLAEQDLQANTCFMRMHVSDVIYLAIRV